MIGSAFKKLARENEMTIDQGVAYGSMRGYATTLSEGMGYKLMVITTKIPDADKKVAFEDALNSKNLEKEFRVQRIVFWEHGFTINFLDNPGTMKKINAFIEWFFPLLDEAEAQKSNICSKCGGDLGSSGTWTLINDIAYHFHDSCSAGVQEEITQELEEMKRQDKSSYLTGTIGAVLGALIGAIPWAVLLYFGYFASIVGFLIGWLANKGYELLRGKNGKGKIVILILVSLVAIIVGNMAVDVFVIAEMITAGELPGFTYGDILPSIIELFKVDSEYRTATIGNLVMGLIFAFLGIGSILLKTYRETKGTKIKNLK